MWSRRFHVVVAERHAYACRPALVTFPAPTATVSLSLSNQGTGTLRLPTALLASPQRTHRRGSVFTRNGSFQVLEAALTEARRSATAAEPSRRSPLVVSSQEPRER